MRNICQKILQISLLLMAGGIGAQPVLSQSLSWEIVDIEKLQIDPDEIRDLKVQYADLSDPILLQQLLDELNFLYPASSLWAERKNGIHLIHLERIPVFYRAKVSATTRQFVSPISNLVQQFSGLPDSSFLRAAILDSIKDFLAKKGFFSPNIELEVERNGYDIQYLFFVDYGKPCLVTDVSWQEEFPNPPHLIERFCDKKAIRDTLLNQQQDLRKAGYVQANLEKFEFEFLDKKTKAILNIQSRIGKKLVYQVQEERSLLQTLDILNLTGLEKDFDPYLVQPENLVSFVRQTYQDAGYYAVEVSQPEKIETESQVIYRVTVNRGDEFSVRSIDWVGNNHLNAKQLRSILNIDSLFSSRPIFSEDQISSALENVSAYYQDIGFWDARVTIVDRKIDRFDASVELRIRVEEGKRYILQSIRNLPATVSSEDFSLNEEDFGQPLSRSKVDDFRNELQQQLINQSFLYATIQLDLEIEEDLSSVYVTIDPNVELGPQVKIGRISVRGLTNVSRRVVFRELDFNRGDLYDPVVLAETRRALIMTNLFSSVRIETQSSLSAEDRPPIVDLMIVVQESLPGRIGFGPGWSLFKGGRFQVEGSYSNLAGFGRKVFVKASLSEEKNQTPIGTKTLVGHYLGISFVEPYVLEHPIEGSVNLATSAVADQTWKFSNSVQFNLSHTFKRMYKQPRLSLFSRQSVTREESSISQAEGYLNLIGGSVRKSEFGGSAEWDVRNSLAWPSKGFLVEAEYGKAIDMFGSNLDFDRWNTQLSLYYPLFSKVWVAAMSLYFEKYENIRRRENYLPVLPSTQTLYLGGGGSIRGFAEQSLGPVVRYKNNDDQFEQKVYGGSHKFVFKFEIRREIISESFGAKLFLDGGNTFLSKAEENYVNESSSPRETEIIDNFPYEFTDMFTAPSNMFNLNYMAYGIGASYLTPLGSINFSYGFPHKRCPVEGACEVKRADTTSWLKSGRFHLDIGATF